MSQNYPNPFSSVTYISYTINEHAYVKLKILDVLGNEKSVLVQEFQEEGTYIVRFDGSGIPGGVYFCVLQAGAEVVDVIKMHYIF